jgi:signal transduction histidine kinase
VVDIDELVRSAVTVEGDGRVVAGALVPAAVRGDREALRRALGNLIENGLVHGPPGGRVTVAVAITRDSAPGMVHVAVSDTGIGPDAAAGERLFERFWRGPGASQRPGAGLGLSIVAAIADVHDGRVEVDGSTFTLVLPAAADQPVV